jgi:hypothetical protein
MIRDQVDSLCGSAALRDTHRLPTWNHSDIWVVYQPCSSAPSAPCHPRSSPPPRPGRPPPGSGPGDRARARRLLPPPPRQHQHRPTPHCQRRLQITCGVSHQIRARQVQVSPPAPVAAALPVASDSRSHRRGDAGSHRPRPRALLAARSRASSAGGSRPRRTA